MALLTLPFDAALARKVSAETLEPRQRSTPPRLKIARDFYQRVMLKHPFPPLSEFQSLAELLHAALLEGTPAVTSYVPQPFRLRIGRESYTPDCYVVRASGPPEVRELTANGQMREDRRVPVTHYLARHGLQFQVLSSEALIARRIEAENWLQIVQILHQARDLTTDTAEFEVLDRLSRGEACALGEVVDAGDRERTYQHEIALFRLLHQGRLAAQLADRPLDWDTGFWLWRS